MGQLAGVITASLPPVRPSHFPRRAGGAHDGALPVQSEALVAEALERRLENPRLKRHAGCFAEGIELLRYPERLYCGIDASWRDNDLLDREGILTSARSARCFRRRAPACPPRHRGRL